MTFARFVGVLALVAAPVSLQSQSVAAGPRASLQVAAGGVAPLGGALDPYDPGWTAALGLRLRPWALPVALQLDALHARLGGDPFTVPGPADGPVRVEPRTAISALTGSAVLAPRAGRRVRPYLLAGAGVYRLRPDDRAFGAALVSVRPADATTAAGASYGGGLEARLGRVAPFVEVRHHIVLLSADNTSFIPAVVGLRF
jgi:hypothetical protein